MQDKGLSFKPYWKKEKENFEKQGVSPSLDYPLFNDMINGMLFKSFDEILKSGDNSNMSYNPHKNEFLKNFKLYLNELKRDVSKVYQVVEVNLHRIQKKISKYMATVTKPEGKTLAPQIENLYNRLVLINKFAQFNYEIYTHVIKKIGKQFDKLEIKFETEGFLTMMQDDVSNVFLGNLRIQETIHQLQLLIKFAMSILRESNTQFEVLDDKAYLLKNLDDDIDMRRRKFIRFAPQERVESITKQFEDKKAELLAERETEVVNTYGRSATWKKDLLKTNGPYADGTRQETEVQLVSARDSQAAHVQPVKNPSSLLSNGKPTGDDSPLDIDEGEEKVKKLDEEEDDNIDAHRVREIEKYFVDIDSGFVQTAQACYSISAPWFVLIHTFFYMLTYYGITPTTYDYNLIMGIPKPYFGLVSAFTPAVASLACFIYNVFTTVHYKGSYLISIGCLMSGTFLYSLAFTFRSLALLFIGRALFGYGGGRILTRKFFTREIHIDHRIKWSAILVGFTGMSMTFGPGLSALLETLIDSSEAHSVHLDNFTSLPEEEQTKIMNILTGFTIGGMRFSKVNYVTMFTFCIFVVMFFAFLFLFQDTPPKSAEEVEAEKKLREASSSGLRYQISHIDNIHLLPEDKRSSKYGHADKHKKLQEFKDKLSSATKYFTDKQTYYICLYFFVIKAIQECIVVESPAYIIKNYKHTSALSGLIFFLFTFFTLPSALAPSFLKKKFEDRAMLRFSSLVLIASIIVKCQFSKPLYPFGLFIFGSCAVLGLALAVETCCSSILTKVISEKKAKSFMNAGILAGLIDTLGRVTGSTSITIITLFADYSILNCILYPFWLLVFICIVLGLIGMYNRLDMKMYVKFG